jgi:hypothetical protein
MTVRGGGVSSGVGAGVGVFRPAGSLRSTCNQAWEESKRSKANLSPKGSVVLVNHGNT